MEGVNFNYANRLNPLKYNLPIFYHRFTAIKINTVKSLEAYGLMGTGNGKECLNNKREVIYRSSPDNPQAL